MAFLSKSLAAVAFLALLPLGACATQGGTGVASLDVQPYQGAPGAYAETGPVPTRVSTRVEEGLLSSPPNNARPGECYAKVVVPGQPIGAPPAQQRAVWVQTPPGPGQVSPTWCIYYEPGAPQQPVAMTPERYGWIRVICDKDATVDEITHVQHRLHDWGVYEGAYDGHYDAATAQGVVRFQEQRHIEHGGYLSVKTVEALDGAPPPTYQTPTYQVSAYPSTVQQQAFASPCGPAACRPAPPVVYAPPAPPRIIYQPSPPQVVVQRVIQPVYQQVYAPPPPPQVVYQPSPPQVVVQRVVQPVYQPIYAQAPQMGCGQPACMPQPQPYPCGPVCGAPGGQGWGGQGYGGGNPQGTPPYRALLSWPGKTTY